MQPGRLSLFKTFRANSPYQNPHFNPPVSQQEQDPDPEVQLSTRTGMVFPKLSLMNLPKALGEIRGYVDGLIGKFNN